MGHVKWDTWNVTFIFCIFLSVKSNKFVFKLEISLYLLIYFFETWNGTPDMWHVTPDTWNVTFFIFFSFLSKVKLFSLKNEIAHYFGFPKKQIALNVVSPTNQSYSVFVFWLQNFTEFSCPCSLFILHYLIYFCVREALKKTYWSREHSHT